MLAWRLSNTLTTDFCLDAVREAIWRHGVPEIFNTDQGSQFTSAEFTGLLKAQGIRISMDGKGCWRDNVFVEWLWRSVKYEEVYLKAYDSMTEAKTQLGAYLAFYNTRRPHRAFDGQTLDAVYFAGLPTVKAAARGAVGNPAASILFNPQGSTYPGRFAVHPGRFAGQLNGAISVDQKNAAPNTGSGINLA